MVGLSTYSQNHSTWTILDTIHFDKNKPLIHYMNYSDSILTEEGQAYFVPTTIKIPRFKLLRNTFTKKVAADSIIFHGQRKTYLKNKYLKTENFQNGNKISVKYFDSNGQEINEQEYSKNNLTIGPCGNPLGQYYLHGIKKKNN